MAERATYKELSKLTLSDRTIAVSEVLFASIGEGAIVIDEKGNISQINDAALEILGCKEADMIGKWYPETVVALDMEGKEIPNIERPITEVFLSGKAVFRRMYFRKKDGQQVPVAATVSPVILNNRPLGAIEVFRNIADELQLERAKDEFISIASHQLRTPASVVKQYLGMIIEGYIDSPEEQLGILQVAYEHNNNQLEIINDLLNVAQAEANKLKINYKETDLVALLKKVIAGQTADFRRRNISLTLEAEEAQILANVDPLHIQMVFENIINNANKYSNPNTSVTVSVSATSRLATIRVKDQGIGIAKKDIPKLFNKFVRIDNVRSTASGTGLGLYWAKTLVELHGGRIRIESELDKGSTVIIRLPREKAL